MSPDQIPLPKAMQGMSAVIHTVAIAIEKGGRRYEIHQLSGDSQYG